MKIATFNVNGINGRLSVLLQWLAEAEPDVVCLQELKAPKRGFRKQLSAGLATGRSGKGKRAGMESPFLPEALIRSRPGRVCRATRAILTVGISRQR
jgi:hypothetical protein